jgi:phosphatidate phosphatase APP1
MGILKKDPLQIITFHSYGKANRLYARGRAIEDEAINLSNKGLFKLMLNNFKRFETDEVKNTALTLMLSNGRSFQTVTDNDGCFIVDEVVEGLDLLMNEQGWLQYEISYTTIPEGRNVNLNNRFPGEMIIPSRAIEYGIISDIDDTILHTGVVSRLKWRLLLNTFFKRAEKRIPLDGAAVFYHKLQRGSTGTKANPVYYVSHSPWNLYRYLEHFLTLNKFPKGPILLRSFSSIFLKQKGEKPQKQKEIIQLLKMYPMQQFILIGDSGEHDADIYIEIAAEHPNRIKAIYLRSVNHQKRMIRIRGLFEGYKATPALLVDSSIEAEAHARENGFIL